MFSQSGFSSRHILTAVQHIKWKINIILQSAEQAERTMCQQENLMIHTFFRAQVSTP
jgi:hypothetical protein